MTYITQPTYYAYYINLHLKGVIDKLRFRFRNTPIIYGIRCSTNNKVYIGSTLQAQSRFNKHLIKTKDGSNLALQNDIVKYGLDKFTVYIYEIVDIPSNLTQAQKTLHLRSVEQRYINMVVKTKLYNGINSFKNTKSPSICYNRF